MKLKTFLIPAFIICFTTNSFAQKIYSGTLVTKLGQALEGEITVNLQGINEDLIKVSTTEKSKRKGIKQSITTNTSINTAIIKHIIIDGTTYFFRNIKTDYDIWMKNVCMQLVYGTIECGLFQNGNSTEQHSFAVKFPKSSTNELVSTEYYDASSFTVAIQLNECNSLYKKIVDKDETVSWTEKSSRE